MDNGLLTKKKNMFDPNVRLHKSDLRTSINLFDSSTHRSDNVIRPIYTG
jgi:hypothetical protein